MEDLVGHFEACHDHRVSSYSTHCIEHLMTLFMMNLDNNPFICIEEWTFIWNYKYIRILIFILIFIYLFNKYLYF